MDTDILARLAALESVQSSLQRQIDDRDAHIEKLQYDLRQLKDELRETVGDIFTADKQDRTKVSPTQPELHDVRRQLDLFKDAIETTPCSAAKKHVDTTSQAIRESVAALEIGRDETEEKLATLTSRYNKFETKFYTRVYRLEGRTSSLEYGEGYYIGEVRFQEECDRAQAEEKRLEDGLRVHDNNLDNIFNRVETLERNHHNSGRTRR